MEIIDLKKLNLKERVKPEINIQGILPELNTFNDNFQLREASLSKTDLQEKRQSNKNFRHSSELEPVHSFSVFEQAIQSWKEIENFEFKKMDADFFYDKELKRFNRLLI